MGAKRIVWFNSPWGIIEVIKIEFWGWVDVFQVGGGAVKREGNLRCAVSNTWHSAQLDGRWLSQTGHHLALSHLSPFISILAWKLEYRGCKSQLWANEWTAWKWERGGGCWGSTGQTMNGLYTKWRNWESFEEDSWKTLKESNRIIFVLWGKCPWLQCRRCIGGDRSGSQGTRWMVKRLFRDDMLHSFFLLD